jgi:dienelactone hydrolase
MVTSTLLGLVLAQAPLAFPPFDNRVQMTPDVVYATADSGPQRMDVYRVPGTGAGAGFRPVMLFFIRAVGPERHQRVYDAWARAAASRGLVAILPDLRPGPEIADADLVHAYVRTHAADLGVDADNTVVYGASGNVATAFPAAEDSRRSWITAAVMYYGTAEVANFRRDLPVFWVRAGLDRPAVNASIISLAERALRENVPLTLLNQQTGHHGFDLLDPDAATRTAVEQTLDFVVHATQPDYQATLGAAAAEATAAAHVASGRFADAAAAYRALSRAHPTDARLGLAYGEALLGATQYAAACAQFETLRDKDLGARDLGLPAAEACLKKGDADAAMAWLASIPPQFRPASLKDDPAFAALRNRPDFQALFSPRVM